MTDVEMVLDSIGTFAVVVASMVMGGVVFMGIAHVVFTILSVIDRWRFRDDV